jgi:hypothetical protein
LVRYVNGALVGAWDALRRRGVSDGDAAAMLSGAFEVGIAVIEQARPETLSETGMRPAVR